MSKNLVSFELEKFSEEETFKPIKRKKKLNFSENKKKTKKRRKKDVGEIR